MAEDQDDNYEEFEGGRKSRAVKKVYVRNYEECNVRLDELAKPRKWYLLSTYQENINKFEEDRLERIRTKIQEEFSLSPEETEKYMERFKRKIKTDIRKRELLREIKKQKKIAKKKAYLLFRKYIKRGMMFACQNCPPAIVSPVVNSVSDAILKILAEIHNVPVPKRRDNDKISQFLMANADWLAIAICSIYYDVEIEQKKEIEAQIALEKQLAMDKEKNKRPPEEETEVQVITAEDEDDDEEEEAEMESGVRKAKGEEAEMESGVREAKDEEAEMENEAREDQAEEDNDLQGGAVVGRTSTPEEAFVEEYE